MNCVDLLQSRGPMRAVDVARFAGLPLAEAYVELVRAEAQGLVEIRCMDRSNQSAARLWAPTPETV